MVECAIVEDDIERECFVSRVYCWFTEKLVEKRELTNRNRSAGYDGLKHSLKSMPTQSEHALKALDSYAAQQAKQLTADTGGPAAHLLDDEKPKQAPEAEHRFANMRIPDRNSKFGPRSVPVYVRHGFPDIIRGPGDRRDYSGFLPKIPGAEENYGMVHHVPESDAERNMHELWMARRRQEAFEWKAKQQMNVVLDRLALQKSRMESEGLRKHEVNAMIDMSKPNRPQTTDGGFSRSASKGRHGSPIFRPFTSSGAGGRRSASRDTHNSDDDASVHSAHSASRQSSPALPDYK